MATLSEADSDDLLIYCEESSCAQGPQEQRYSTLHPGALCACTSMTGSLTQYYAFDKVWLKQADAGQAGHTTLFQADWHCKLQPRGSNKVIIE